MRKSRQTMIAGTVAAIAVSGIAFAAVPKGGAVIPACANKRTCVLRVRQQAHRRSA